MSKCVVCVSESIGLIDKDGYSMSKCPKCGLVFVDVPPTDDFLKNEVYSAKNGYQGNKKKFNENARLNRAQKDLLRSIGRDANMKKVLDVGCSNGEFLFALKKIGVDAYGVELNAGTAQVGIDKGLNIFRGTLQEAAFAINFFDYIYLGDLVEHVTDPVDLIHECSRILKGGGSLIISTPNLDCFWARITFLFYKFLNIPWSVMTPPHHLFYFSDENLVQFARRAGFERDSAVFFPPPTLKYELGSLHLLRRLKQERSVGSLLMLLFSFFLYTLAYAVNMALALFLAKDFSMLAYFKKNA